MDLERQIYEQVTTGIGEAIKERLTKGWADAPLNKLVDSVVVSREPKIRKLIEDAFDGAMTGDLRSALRDALTHKLARVLLSKMEGEIEKRTNELRTSPEIRARITLAIEAAIKST